jgi:hypothetical protein
MPTAPLRSRRPRRRLRRMPPHLAAGRCRERAALPRKVGGRCLCWPQGQQPSTLAHQPASNVRPQSQTSALWLKHGQPEPSARSCPTFSRHARSASARSRARSASGTITSPACYEVHVPRGQAATSHVELRSPSTYRRTTSRKSASPLSSSASTTLQSCATRYTTSSAAPNRKSAGCDPDDNKTWAFESSTAHLSPRSHAVSAWLRGSEGSDVPRRLGRCPPRCPPRCRPHSSSAFR